MIICLFSSPDVHGSARRKGDGLFFCHLKPTGHFRQPMQLSLNSSYLQYFLQISLHAFHETAHTSHRSGSKLFLCNGGKMLFKRMTFMQGWFGNCSKAR